MTNNNGSLPYFIQINEPFQTIQLSDSITRIDEQSQQSLALNPVSNQILVEFPENPVQIVQENAENAIQDYQIIEDDTACIYQIVYPQDLNLQPAYNVLKRGRPKKKKCDREKPSITKLIDKPDIATKPPKTARTRSGRLVQVPKHIEQDFKKIEIATDEQEIQVTDFKRFEEKENSKMEFVELQAKKRQISAQYKCPKCLKAYLGKNRMIQHLTKYPDHGPLPENQKQYNFDVWNYLFDITQKSKSGQRGIKFCEELSNLLHNVQLLKNALFKTVTDSKNCVHIDKVLGNAIGLAPGKYKFDENELYKDVTVLKLITNSDFFKPNAKSSNELETTNQVIEQTQLIEKSTELRETKSGDVLISQVENSEKNKPTDDTLYQMNDKCNNNKQDPIDENFTKKIEDDSQLSLHSDLLSDNLLLTALPNSSRHPVDELMLSSVVDNHSNLLDNSTSSDEVMNVDQFVNERFKKIIEPDIELANTSLNLDLPSLELFQFHTT